LLKQLWRFNGDQNPFKKTAFTEGYSGSQ
jgi:hypothetical protein